MAAEVTKHDSLKTVQGQDVKIKNGDGVTVDNARIVAADIETDNGVIHVIDNVILPA